MAKEPMPNASKKFSFVRGKENFELYFSSLRNGSSLNDRNLILRSVCGKSPVTDKSGSKGNLKEMSTLYVI